MDELTLFGELAPPPPADAAEMCARARERLTGKVAQAGMVAQARAVAQAGALTGAAPPSARRGRRRLALAGAVVVAAAGAAVVVPAVVPGGGSVPLVTKAWAVQRNGDGTVTLRLRQIFKPAGLEQALRAEGVPAVVRVTHAHDPLLPINEACPAPAGDLEPASVQRAVVGPSTSRPAQLSRGVAGFLIHPSAIPKGSVLYIDSVTGDTWNFAFTLPVVLKNDRMPPCAANPS